MSSKANKGRLDPETYHDFNSEKLAVLVLGGFAFLKKPVIFFFLNAAVFTCVLVLYMFMMCMAIFTIIMVREDTHTVARVMQALCVLLAVVMMHLVNLTTGSRLEVAMQLLKTGLYKYIEELPEERHSEIVKNRVKQIRYLNSAITKMYLFTALNNAIVLPLIELLFGSGNETDKIVNPYLPVPLYMPFDTSTKLGFGVAYLSNCSYLCFSNATVICFMTTYLSCSLQLEAQLEILNESLTHTWKRALARLLRDCMQTELTPYESLYYLSEFQQCLHFCLKENVFHHQSILRLKDAIGPFTERMNFICMLLLAIFMGSSLMAVLESPGFNALIILPVVVSQFCYFQMCRLGQTITDKSSQIKDSLYSTPWPIGDKNFNILLKIMIINVQKPIILKAAGFNTDVSLKSFGDVISTGYKIVNVLR